MNRKPLFKNQLAQIREDLRLGQKQVAQLLGHSSTDPISRYERGIRIPNLKTALKLAQIYNIPIRTMLDEYYLACLEEMRGRDKVLRGLKEREAGPAGGEGDFCTFEIKISAKTTTQNDIDAAKRHTAQLKEKLLKPPMSFNLPT